MERIDYPVVSGIERLARLGFGVEDIAVKIGEPLPVVRRLVRKFKLWPEAWLPK